MLFVGEYLQKVTENPYKSALPSFSNIAQYTTYKDVGGDTEVSTQCSGHGWLEQLILNGTV